MKVDEILADADFGHLYVRFNARAVKFTFRPANDGTPQCGILVTSPCMPDWREKLEVSLTSMRPRLEIMLQRQLALNQQQTITQHIDWDFRIESDCLRVSLQRGSGEGFFLHNESVRLQEVGKGDWEVLKPAVLQVICPPDCDFDIEDRQAWLEKVIIEGVRKHAKEQLIPRMMSLALQHHIKLNEVKVNSSKGRWGSCGQHRQGDKLSSTQYNINLSLFTLLLPLPVQRLIMLHELAHTRHMDHSAAFHAELDQWLCGREVELERRLKAYSPDIFSFSQPRE